jgi:hypothetical protein
MWVIYVLALWELAQLQLPQQVLWLSPLEVSPPQKQLQN